MDTLTFNAPVLYRHLTFSEAKKQPISEISLERALEGLEMDMGQVYSANDIRCPKYPDFSSSSSICAYYLDAIIWNLSKVLVPNRR